jgi:hypothetical protein
MSYFKVGKHEKVSWYSVGSKVRRWVFQNFGYPTGNHSAFA